MDKFFKRKRESLSCVSGHSSESESDDDVNSALDNRLPSTKKACPPKRKYYKSYLKFGFISTDSGDKPRPQCVICLEILANASMKLSRHQVTKHRETVGKSAEFFKLKNEGLRKQTSSLKKITTLNSSGLKASYEVELRVKGNT